MKSILAFDPGGHTGIALRDHEGNILTCVVMTPQEVWQFIRDGADEVVYERFASSKATSHDALYTIELCGAIQALCWDRGIPCIRHEPQNRYAFLDEARSIVQNQRKVQREKLGDTAIHEIDALAHLLCHEQLGPKIITRRWGKGISNA